MEMLPLAEAVIIVGHVVLANTVVTAIQGVVVGYAAQNRHLTIHYAQNLHLKVIKALPLIVRNAKETLKKEPNANE